MSPLGGALTPLVAWMVERDGTFVHVADTERAQLELMRGSAELTKLDGTLSNESLDHVPGIDVAAMASMRRRSSSTAIVSRRSTRSWASS